MIRIEWLSDKGITNTRKSCNAAQNMKKATIALQYFLSSTLPVICELNVFNKPQQELRDFLFNCYPQCSQDLAKTQRQRTNTYELWKTSPMF